MLIEAANKYVVIHTSSLNHIARQTIKSLEDTLDPKVRELHPLFHGDYIVKLTNGAELTLSRNFPGSFFNQMSR
jgi:DNA-binding LytR/AlgR family response regulator